MIFFRRPCRIEAFACTMLLRCEIFKAVGLIKLPQERINVPISLGCSVCIRIYNRQYFWNFLGTSAIVSTFIIILVNDCHFLFKLLCPSDYRSIVVSAAKVFGDWYDRSSVLAFRNTYKDEISKYNSFVMTACSGGRFRRITVRPSSNKNLPK